MPTLLPLHGLGVSGGVADGVLKQWEEHGGHTDYVVLLDELDGRIALLGDCRGVVAASGGITSHGAVLARELALPCVVVTVEQMEVLARLGAIEVEIDGWEGEIRIHTGQR